MSALSHEEAAHLFLAAVDALEALDDCSRSDSLAVPKAVMNKGDAMTFLGALIALLAESYPVSGSANVLDLVVTYYRPPH
jgi:hypothetical protein